MRNPWVSDDRVTVQWTQIGQIDEVIAAVVARENAIRADPGNHFVGVSIRWDETNSLSLICRIEYDRDKKEEGDEQ